MWRRWRNQPCIFAERLFWLEEMANTNILRQDTSGTFQNNSSWTDAGQRQKKMRPERQSEVVAWLHGTWWATIKTWAFNLTDTRNHWKVMQRGDAVIRLMVFNKLFWFLSRLNSAGARAKADRPFWIYLTGFTTDSPLYEECLRMNDGFSSYLVSLILHIIWIVIWKVSWRG